MQRDYTCVDSSGARRTATSTYQHVEKSSPFVFSPSRITPSEWTTRIQTHRHPEAVESDDTPLVLLTTLCLKKTTLKKRH